MFLNTNLKQKASDFDHPQNCLSLVFHNFKFRSTTQLYPDDNVSHCGNVHNVPQTEQKRVHIEFMSNISNGKTQINNYQNKHRKKPTLNSLYTRNYLILRIAHKKAAK